MKQDLSWAVEYSVDKKVFRVKELETDHEHTFSESRDAASNSYQQIALFVNKQLASIFYESLQQKRSEVEKKTNENQAFSLINKASVQTLSYELVLGLICTEFSNRPKDYLKQFCQEHSLPMLQMESLLNNPRYCLEGALLVARILISLDFLVKMMAVILFEEKDIESGKEEISYYFTKKSLEEN